MHQRTQPGQICHHQTSESSRQAHDASICTTSITAIRNSEAFTDIECRPNYLFYHDTSPDFRRQASSSIYKTSEQIVKNTLPWRKQISQNYPLWCRIRDSSQSAVFCSTITYQPPPSTDYNTRARHYTHRRHFITAVISYFGIINFWWRNMAWIQLVDLRRRPPVPY
jgi:hypothetical protein